MSKLSKIKEKNKEEENQATPVSLVDLIDDKSKSTISSIFSRVTTNTEFELMFYNYKDSNKLGLEKFLKILNYLNYKSRKEKLTLNKTTTLDVIYQEDSNPDTRESFRATIVGTPAIARYTEMLHDRKNHVIISVLANRSLEDSSIILVKKVKDSKNIINVDDFDLRFRLSQEVKLSKQEFKNITELDHTKMGNITFRYKQRVSLNLLNTNSSSNSSSKETTLSIDLTTVKTNNNLNFLESSNYSYELEIDLSSNSTTSIPSKYLNTIYENAELLLKILDQTNFLITNTEKSLVISKYADLLSLDKKNLLVLDGRKAESLEIQHVVDKLPNLYAVTDKADGDRYFLIIVDDRVYLISYNLHVKYTGITLNKSLIKYNSTILDGELVFLPKLNKYLFLAFDCLYLANQDSRQIIEQYKRLALADELIENCFASKNYIKLKEYNDKNINFDKILEFHSSQIAKYMSSINLDLSSTSISSISSSKLLIRRKYFISVTGAQNNEIFKYANLMWTKYLFDTTLVNCPYTIDGLMFHPINQKYTTTSMGKKKDTDLVEYKWKPPVKNSIDFYIRFERDRKTNKILVLFDNSDDENELRNKPYKIANLYVGYAVDNVHKPILFQPELNNHIAHLYLINGEVRDLEGNIIQDNTVVEFYYNNDINVPHDARWTPLRTRQDKTEIVQKYKHSFGNYSTVANKVFRSITNPFVFEDITILSDDKLYTKHLNLLRSRIEHSTLIAEAKENAYYQVKSNLARALRNYHNYIKTVIIYTYCNSEYTKNKKKLSILDVGVGQGGDILKFYYGKIDFYVGVDIDNTGIISPVNGALSRVAQFKKTFPNFPKMDFINADFRVSLDYETQKKTIGIMSKENDDLLKYYFSSSSSSSNKIKIKYDRLNFSFSIHYFFESTTTFKNLLDNINSYLKPGGYLTICGVFDAHRVVKLLGNKPKVTGSYTNNRGEKLVLYEIVKKYDDAIIGVKESSLILPGATIDVHMASFNQEGVYTAEYLVDKNFITKEFKEKCNLDLVDGDLFENFYYMNEKFLTSSAKYESVEKTRNSLESFAEYYNPAEEIDQVSLQITKLNRYYVFRKAV